jgi:hypothetical protein
LCATILSVEESDPNDATPDSFIFYVGTGWISPVICSNRWRILEQLELFQLRITVRQNPERLDSVPLVYGTTSALRKL